MKKNATVRFLIVLLALLMVLSGCGAQPAEPAGDDVQDGGDTVATAQLINLVSCEGEVSVQDTEGKTTAAYDGMRLVPGDTIVTGADSLANLDLDQGRLVMLSADSRLELRQVEQDCVTLYLNTGRVLNDVEKGHGSYTVQTDNMTMGVLGTVFAVSADATDASPASVMLLEGSVGVSFSATGPQEGSFVTEGTGLTLEPGQQFTATAENIEQSITAGALQTEEIDFSGYPAAQLNWMQTAVENRLIIDNETERVDESARSKIDKVLDKIEKELKKIEEQSHPSVPTKIPSTEPPQTPEPSQSQPSYDGGGYTPPPAPEPTVGTVDTNAPNTSNEYAGSFPGMETAWYNIAFEGDVPDGPVTKAILTASVTKTDLGANITFVSQHDSRDFLSLIFNFIFSGSTDNAPVYVNFNAENRNFGTIRAFDTRNYSSMSIVDATPNITVQQTYSDVTDNYVTCFTLEDPSILNTRAYNAERDAMVYTVENAEAWKSGDSFLVCDTYDGVYATATSLQLSSASPALYVKTSSAVTGSFVWSPANDCATNLWNRYGLARVYQPVTVIVPTMDPEPGPVEP